MPPLLIYAPRETPRLTYILRFFFKELIGTDFVFTHKKEEFLRLEQPVLNYSKAPMNKGIWIQSHSLLFEMGMKEIDPQASRWNDLPILFPTGPEPDLPFDPLAACFYCITRFEEYFSFSPDAWFRFPATESLAYREGFLDEPVVDLWAFRLRTILKIRYPELVFHERKYRFIPTIDVDQAWAYHNKGLLRNLGGGVKFLLRGDFLELTNRIGTLVGKRPDPFYSFEYLKTTFEHYKMKAIFFFQVGQYGKFDKNISGRHPAMKELITKVKTFAQVGIHPSFRAYDSPKTWSMEVDLLNAVSEEKTLLNRLHYIRLRFPKTYRKMISLGMHSDYSMGFPDAIGFRAGTATPYLYYDLGEERETELMVYPFQVMDSCLNLTLKLSPENAMKAIGQVIKKIKKINGTFIPVWHNSSLYDQREWKGWKKVFEAMLEEGKV